MAKPIEHRRREPAPGIFRLVLPLPFPGLNRVNAYLLADGDAATLVDCGIYFPSGEDAHGWDHLVGALDAAGYAPEQLTRLIVTHPHIDHYGMAGRLIDEVGCELWMHEQARTDLQAYIDPEAETKKLRELFEDHGVRADDLDELTAFEDWRPMVSSVVEADRWLSGGERVAVGGREWEIVYTPGHSASHVCPWSASDRILISGDHLLPTVTPHIDFSRRREDPLGEFLASLQVVEDLHPALVLPGHGHPFEEGAERARIIMRHHDRRLGAILHVIRKNPATADEITDEIFGTELLNFQRRLALGEALAHVAYLRKRGEVERIEQPDGTFVYKKATRRRGAEDGD